MWAPTFSTAAVVDDLAIHIPCVATISLIQRQGLFHTLQLTSHMRHA